VNDRLSATPGGSGRSVQKDPYVVQSLVLTAERRTRHIEDLLQLARDFGVDGIEIDYEQIGADDWPRYAEMIREAEQAFRAEGVGLQIVVEPAAGPIRHLDPILFPGPTVGPTVMSYNLFGLHSGPGPKNTPELIDRIVERIGADKVPRYRIAFATGGIEWVDGSGTRSFRESDAREILADSGTTLARGPDGHAHFAYTGDDGSRREVWFEDAVSFEHQWQAAADRGFTDLAIWRLGGNSPELFDLLRRIRTGAP
jgi:spore germination protein YaaH